ncbi:MAG: hypothetical protein IPN29_14820 [Saprospiraceae bacterium]|nr:hypothetical protein [Saprospiraceae bacterium]
MMRITRAKIPIMARSVPGMATIHIATLSIPKASFSKRAVKRITNPTGTMGFIDRYFNFISPSNHHIMNNNSQVHRIQNKYFNI